MKLSDGLTKLVPSVLLFVLYAISFTLLALSLKKIDVSVAYAIWSGLGTALIATIGIVYFKDSVNLLKVLALSLIIVGVVALNLSGGAH